MATITVLSAVVKRLQKNSSYSQHITGDLKDQLDSLRPLLNDDEAIYKHMRDNEFAKKFRQLEKILYKIENLVESQQAGVASISKMRTIMSTLNIKSEHHKFRAELRIISDILNFFREKQLLPVQAPETSQGSSSHNVGGPSLPRKSTKVGEQWDGEHIIRREHDENKLVSALTRGSKSVEVVSIYGVGGIGKTTLAGTLYNKPDVREHFHVRAWQTITQEFRIRDILLGIFSQLRRSNSDLQAITDVMDLAERIHKCLKGQKWLVVLDDVWSIDAWESIKLVLPDDENGSRILVTTRERNVALSMAGKGGIVHSMACLDKDQSWDLFKKRAQLTDSISDSLREQIANKIAVQTGGLPLSVVVLADILKTTSFDQWNSLLRDSEDGISRTHPPEALAPHLDLIYNGLSSVLKPCLLYMGTFPKGSKIEVDTMCQLWIAEGLASTMKIAEGYFDKLALKNLVEVPEEEMSSHQSSRYACLRDLIQDSCILKVEKEDFFEILKLGHTNQPKDSVFRCAIYLEKHEKMEPDLRHNLRSLLFFSNCHQSGEELICSLAIPDLSNLKWIKILHFEGVDFGVGTLPPGVENLVLLRHLSLRDCNLKKLPPYIGKFSFLITLDLRVKKRWKVIVPNVLYKLQNLRHLYLPLEFQTPNHDKLRLDGLTELEILENFDAGIGNVEDVSKLTKLCHLAVSSEGNLQELEQILTCIGLKENHLSKTSLDIRNFASYTEKRLNFIEKLFSCRVLHILRLEGRIGKIPGLDADRASFSEIHLNGSLLEDDPMQTLKMLPHLRVLVLESEAYIGKEMYWSKSGFPELRSLKLSKLYKLESWVVEVDTMPKLSNLTIENCRKMKKLPEKMEYLKALRKLKINMMSKEFVGRLRKVDGKGGEDLYKISTNCLIEFGGDTLRPESTDSTMEIPSSTGTSDVASTSESLPPNE